VAGAGRVARLDNEVGDDAMDLLGFRQARGGQHDWCAAGTGTGDTTGSQMQFS